MHAVTSKQENENKLQAALSALNEQHDAVAADLTETKLALTNALVVCVAQAVLCMLVGALWVKE